MKRYEGSPAVVIERRKGTPDSPFSNMNESLVVTGDGKVLLSEIPNELNRVIVTSEDNTTWYEITEGQIPENGFKVDYINKLVTFNTTHVGKQLQFKYLGEGNHYYSPHSIYTKLEDKTVVETLGDIVEGGKNALDALGALNEKLDEVTQATDNAKEATNSTIIATNDTISATANANEATSEAKKIITRGEQVIVEATDKIDDIDNKIVKVNDELLVADTKLKEVDGALLKIDNIIQDANQSVTNINTVIDEAVETTSNVQLIIDETKSVGEFILSKQYKKNNTVLHNGSTWIALQDTQNNPLPVLPVIENTYWRLVAQRGIDGTGSVVSVNGTFPDVDGNVELDFGNGTVKTVNNTLPDSAGNVVVTSKSINTIAPKVPTAFDYPEGITSFTLNAENTSDTQTFLLWATLIGESDTTSKAIEVTTQVGTYSRSTMSQTIRYLHTRTGQLSLISEHVRVGYGNRWGNPAKTYLADSASGNGGNSFFVSYSLITTIESQKTWNVPVGAYDSETDTMLLYHNTGILDKPSWTLTGEAATGYQVNIPDNPETAIEDNNVIIVVIRNAPTVPEGADISGTRLTENSVALSKLGQDAQEAISNAGNAEAVKQWVKDHGVGDSLKIINESSIITLRESGKYNVLSSGASNTFIPTTVADGIPIEIEVSIYKNGMDELRSLYKISYFEINSSQFKSFMRDKGIDFPDEDSGWLDTTQLNRKEQFKIISPTPPTTKPNDPIFEDGVTTFSSYNSATFAKEWIESLGLIYPSQGNNAVINTMKDPNNASRLIQEVLVTLGGLIVGRFARGGAGTQNWGVFKRLTFDVVNDLTTGGTDKVVSAETVKLLKQELDVMGKPNTNGTVKINDNHATRAFNDINFSSSEVLEVLRMKFADLEVSGVMKMMVATNRDVANSIGGAEIILNVAIDQGGTLVASSMEILTISPTIARDFRFGSAHTMDKVLTISVYKKKTKVPLYIELDYITSLGNAFEVLDSITTSIEMGSVADTNPPQQSIFTHVGNSKSDLATAITGKGVPTSADATFATMVANIDAIPSTKYTTGSVTASSTKSTFTYYDGSGTWANYYLATIVLAFKPKFIWFNGYYSGWVSITYNDYAVQGQAVDTNPAVKMSLYNGNLLQPSTSHMRGILSDLGNGSFSVTIPVYYQSLSLTYHAWGF